MTDTWRAVGRVIRQRRRWIGLSQEDLAQYGGPGKTTVGKIENGRMEPFTISAQQQVERVLGWPLGTIRSMHRLIPEFGDDDQWWADLVEATPPDLAALKVTGSGPADGLTAVSDAALLAEIARRFERHRDQRAGEGDGQQPAANTRAGDAGAEVIGLPVPDGMPTDPNDPHYDDPGVPDDVAAGNVGTGTKPQKRKPGFSSQEATE